MISRAFVRYLELFPLSEETLKGSVEDILSNIDTKQRLNSKDIDARLYEISLQPPWIYDCIENMIAIEQVAIFWGINKEEVTLKHFDPGYISSQCRNAIAAFFYRAFWNFKAMERHLFLSWCASHMTAEQ